MIAQINGDWVMRQEALQTVGACEETFLATLEEQIRSQLSGRVSGFRIQVREHGVVLQGYALTLYAKQLAERTVIEAGHLPIEANEIQVYKGRIPKLQPMR
jgi:hypothetical protein